MTADAARVLDPLLAYVNGKQVPITEACISVLDHGLLYGDGVYEGLSVDGGRIYRLRDHLERLFRSACAIRITPPLTLDGMFDAVLGVAATNRLRDGYLRPIITRGCGPMGLGATHEIITPNLLIIPQVRERLTDEQRLDRGLSAAVIDVRRTPPECMDPRVKSTSYLNQVMGKFAHWDAGADIGVMLTPDGDVAECCGENIFAVTGGVLRTPPGRLVLEGITRDSVMAMHRAAGGEVREERLTPDDLHAADEVFVTATLIEVAAITSIDGRRIGDGSAGPVTRSLIKALRADMRARGDVVSYPGDRHLTETGVA
jgi:branched-chain amino acid aminotransferase